MIWYAAGLVWVLQLLFWGIGLTLLITPARWRRFWPAFCGSVGLALQSLVVWIGSHTALRGTDSYAVPSLAIPAGLLLAAIWRGRRGQFPVGPLVAGARRWWAVGVLMAASLSLQVYPFTKPPGLLTSVAIGSCDAADYAAGARVFEEFARTDRTGLLGQTDIARALPVENFFDFWLQLNHFSPSALIAFHASVCGRQTYELTSLLGVVLLTLHLPGVFWMARSAFRFGQAGSLAVTSIYGFSPIAFYAVYQTALGQLMAVPAVALLTWAGWQAYRGPQTWQRLAAWSGLLLTGDWLLFGGYNFFILFAYVPVVAFAGLGIFRRRGWERGWRLGVLIGANLLACAVLFPGRVLSIVERFALFHGTPFGWSIPGFWPTGWYGAFGTALLTPTAEKWALALAAVALAAAMGSALWQARRGRWHAGVLALCCTLPILCGYWILLHQDRLQHDNSSYDAFKLFAVFYPGILTALCLFLRGPHATWPGRLAATALWAALLVVNVAGAWRFNAVVRRTPLVVDHDLAALSAVERLPEVDSVNILMTQVWDRLWADCLLLRKPQFFALPTYEGRTVTDLHGEWDLTQRLVYAQVGDHTDPLEDNGTYSLLKRRDRRFVEARLDQGWYPVEHFRTETWAWGRGVPMVRVNNPHPDALGATLTFSVRSLHERHLQLRAGDRLLWDGLIGPVPRTLEGIPVVLPPGLSLLQFETSEAPDHTPDDPRGFTFRLNRFQIDVQDARAVPVP